MGLGRLFVHIRHPVTVAKLVAVGALLSVGSAAALPYLNLFFHEHLHAEEPEIGMTFATAAGFLAIGTLLAPFVGERLGKLRGVTALRLAAVPFLLVLAFSPEVSAAAGAGGSLLTLAGAAARWRGPLRAAVAIGVAGTAAIADIARSPTVPGANDNLSGVAGLVALAELVHDRPIRGVRLILLSCGAEETLQDGIRGFLARHRGELDPRRTWFLNLETVGSPHLGLMEAEGPVWMEEYCGPAFRDLVDRSARQIGVEMERGLRARASTDSIIPSRAGYPTATLTSTTPWRALANYHLPTDTPDNVDYRTVAAATRVAYAVAAALAARGAD
jgi:hypothetical protein